ncbi:hypothetical protein [Actinoplanes rectilineatus]|uniref:hypothetical protein n=1 Tax=Actinoplanes rectilineatus TaxID=113571 RepID=UPI0005F29A1F|nr:hypothetical protein [Actinoplanes rectilineatus]
MNYEPLDLTGIVNAQTGNWEIHGKDYVVRRVGLDLYIRVTGDKLHTVLMPQASADHLAAGGWIRSPLPPFREGASIFNDNFPWNLANQATHATAATAVGNRSFAGTYTVDEADSGLTSTKEYSVSVDLDEQGRFSEIALADVGRPDLGVVTTFSDFGVSADITAPPTSEVVDQDDLSILVFLELS